ncbi:hypothetical protein [Microvirga mediterraneensis]|uniref:Uncharacterized protein n=1 Tax=Microvirga mediterraneensis TaxID=2754695 RepID=A0A838BPP0_9HYPH|nr:hypothetical protein [Microvirga mediterraneensis]MBA1156903.1 hypothetical protein [Microvirga mediterraneensis]
MQPRVLAPLNDRLLYINEDGSRREDLIAKAVEDRITVDKLRYAHLSEHWTEEDWYRDAKSVIEARVHGEEQQYWGNVQTRALGGMTVSDDLASKEAQGRLIRRATELYGEAYVREKYDIAIGASIQSEPVDVAPFLQAAE